MIRKLYYCEDADWVVFHTEWLYHSRKRSSAWYRRVRVENNADWKHGFYEFDAETKQQVRETAYLGIIGMNQCPVFRWSTARPLLKKVNPLRILIKKLTCRPIR